MMKLVIVCVIAVTAFAAGWVSHRPNPLPPQRIIELHKVAAVKEAEAARDAKSYAEMKPRLDRARDTLNIHDTVEVIRYVAMATHTLNACEKALKSCQEACRAKDKVIAAIQSAPTASNNPRLNLYVDAGALWAQDSSARPHLRLGSSLRISKHWSVVGEANSDKQLAVYGRYSLRGANP